MKNTEKPIKGTLPPGKRGEYLVVLQFLLMAIFIATPVWPDPAEAAFPTGAPLLRLAVLVVCWSAALLMGGLGSHRIRESLTPLPYPVDHNRLVTTGVYALVRHPLYGSQILAALGWAVFRTSLSHLLLLALGFLFFSFKASKEERWLTEKHPEYRDYARKVKKFIPWIY